MNTCVRSALASVGALVLLSVLIPGLGRAAAAPQASGLTTPSGAGAGAQEAELTAAEVQRRLGESAAEEGLDEAVRAQARAEYDAALEALARAAESRSSIELLNKERDAAPVERDTIKRELARPPEDPQPDVSAEASVAEVEARRDEAAAAAGAARALVEERQAEAAKRATRVEQISAELGGARERLEATRAALEAPAAPGEPAALSAAREVRLRAEVQDADGAIKRFEAERERHQARADLPQLRLDQARRRATTADLLLERWEQVLRERRRREAEQAAEEARRMQADVALRYDALRAAVEENERLTELLSGDEGVVAQLDRVGQELSDLTKTWERLTKSSTETRARYEIAGDTYSTALLLRLEYEELPELRKLRKDARKRKRDIGEAQYQVYVLRRRRDDAAQVGPRVQKLLDGVDENMTPAERERVAEAAEGVYTAEGELLGPLKTNYELLRDQLLELDAASDRLETLTVEYGTFIGERILWVKSVERPFTYRPADVLGGLRWLAGLQNGSSQLTALAADLARHWYLAALVAALGLGLFHLRRRCRREIVRTAPLVQGYKTDSFLLTLRVVACTAVAALPIPLLLVSLDRVLDALPHASVWRLAWSDALRVAGWSLLPLFFVDQTFRREGLAQAHFRWPAESAQRARRMLRVLVPLLLALGLPVLVLENGGEAAWRDSLGRLCFMFAMLFVGAALGRVLSPQGRILGAYYARNPGGIVAKGRVLWLVLGAGTALALLGLALFGYYYSALLLTESFAATLLLVLAVILAYALAARWLFIARRRLAVERAVQRRKERESDERPGEADAEFEKTVDIPALDAQTRNLFRASVFVAVFVGLFTIWSEELPAVRMLDRARLWPRLEVVDAVQVPAATWYAASPGAFATSEATAESSTDSPQAPPPGEGNGTAKPAGPRAPAFGMRPPLPMPAEGEGQAEPATAAEHVITLADVLAALIFTALTVLAARNLPGLLEIGLLSRLPLDAGARYAISTVARYAIVAFGATFVFGALGIGWSTVKWLAAALTFGLAFGLQEIFANFISGLILLAERPIRVGDIVTVGGVEGKVSRIRMRATTVVDWDNRELLVPNKQFITDQVINWTLTDPITRVVISVGAAYGSDTDRVRALLMRVAKESPFALEDPAPVVLFLGFGESSLDFSVRVYIASRSVYVDMMNDVHTRIDKAFRAEGIEIPFPQRDLHLRSAEAELRVREEA